MNNNATFSIYKLVLTIMHDFLEIQVLQTLYIVVNVSNIKRVTVSFKYGMLRQPLNLFILTVEVLGFTVYENNSKSLFSYANFTEQ